jgi:formylmethanofuran dehydrogenase subunit C
MTTWVLSLKHAPALRVDLRGIVPAALTELSLDRIERLPVFHGNDTLPLAELCHVESVDGNGATLVLQGDFSRFDRIGWQLAGGRIEVRGNAGDYVGAGMTAGEIRVSGNAGVLAACEMQGGLLDVAGNVGDFAAAALPGSMDGMRGGTLIVQGSAADRFGDRMRRGTALVFGDAGDFLGSRMVAGSIAVGGRIGAHCAWGMRRGSIVCAGAAPSIAPTFVPTGHDISVFWQLLARDLARFGGPFAGLASKRIERIAGDLAVAGKGELLLLK